MAITRKRATSLLAVALLVALGAAYLAWHSDSSQSATAEETPSEARAKASARAFLHLPADAPLREVADSMEVAAYPGLVMLETEDGRRSVYLDPMTNEAVGMTDLSRPRGEGQVLSEADILKAALQYLEDHHLSVPEGIAPEVRPLSQTSSPEFSVRWTLYDGAMLLGSPLSMVVDGASGEVLQFRYRDTASKGLSTAVFEDQAIEAARKILRGSGWRPVSAHLSAAPSLGRSATTHWMVLFQKQVTTGDEGSGYPLSYDLLDSVLVDAQTGIATRR